MPGTNIRIHQVVDVGGHSEDMHVTSISGFKYEINDCIFNEHIGSCSETGHIPDIKGNLNMGEKSTGGVVENFKIHATESDDAKFSIRKHICTKCNPNKEFPEKYGLKLHLRYHSGQYKHGCDSCQIGYFYHKHYLTH